MAQVYLAPWEWDTSHDEPRWRSPGGTAIGVLDLRTLTAQAAIAGTPGLGVFVYPAPQGIANSIDLGTVLTRVLAGNERSGLRNRLNLPDSIQAGTSVLDLLWNLFTVWSDPIGATAARPLLPTHDGRLELHLGGFSPIRVEAFAIDTHPHAPMVTATLQAIYRRQRTHDLSVGSDTYRRVLDTWAHKYRTDPDRFIPSDLPRETALTHTTEIGDTFTRADNVDMNAANTGKTLDGSAGTWSWTEVAGALSIVSNGVRVPATTNQSNHARAEQDLSSDDMEVSAAVSPMTFVSFSRTAGVLARYDPADITWYILRQRVATALSGANDLKLQKVISNGASTDLGAPLREPVANDVLLVRADGSSISGLVNGATVISPVTDTAITGFLRSGVFINPGGGATTSIGVDTFLAEDLVPTPPPARPPPSTNRIARQSARRRHPAVASPGGFF